MNFEIPAQVAKLSQLRALCRGEGLVRHPLSNPEQKESNSLWRGVKYIFSPGKTSAYLMGQQVQKQNERREEKNILPFRLHWFIDSICVCLLYSRFPIKPGDEVLNRTKSTLVHLHPEGRGLYQRDTTQTEGKFKDFLREHTPVFRLKFREDVSRWKWEKSVSGWEKCISKGLW